MEKTKLILALASDISHPLANIDDHFQYQRTRIFNSGAQMLT
ncbi:hypothetical protein EV129_118122 [Rhizobium azibense]|uniref:Uncharacterized protein n=1 Tax=Rhizobium azibense TaxID=1136135 RepID=A0A4R3RBU6_9HYPH|nr:hypothetical protein EV129_118122 [Rhizobium azibense]